MATEIELTRGQVALVDPEDLAWLMGWGWFAAATQRGRFVAMRGERVDGQLRMVYMHRQIMGLSHGDGLEVDHLNHHTLDNRRSNLRVVTPTANKRGQPSRGGSSAFVGVTWDSARACWRAQIQVAGIVINLGRFAVEEDAARARDRYVVEHRTGHRLNLRCCRDGY
jgi:hypothetical protein